MTNTQHAVLEHGLQLDELSVELERDGRFRAVNEVSLRVRPDRILTIIGESGSGKSMLLKAIAGIEPRGAVVSGRMHIDGALRRTPGSVQDVVPGTAMVFQNPMTSLDPSYRIGAQLAETIRRHRPLDRAAARERAIELLAATHLLDPEGIMRLYPHECSGGMRQRIVMAIALACEPSVLLADEPTTALDIGVQAKLLALIRELHRAKRMTTVLVTHDIAVAKAVADDVAVMYAGRIVEQGPLAEVLADPRHPYTRGLLAANITRDQSERPVAIPGMPPNLVGMPSLCAFAPRCPLASSACWSAVPETRTLAPSHEVACIHAA